MERHQAPSKMEQRLRTGIAEAWCQSLKTHAPADEDDFFSLGGDSLAATTLISKLRSLTQLQLPLALVFSNSSFGSLADAVLAEVLRDGTRPIPMFRRDHARSIASTSINQWNRLTRDQDQTLRLGQRLPHNVTIAYKMDASIEDSAIVHALSTIAQRHDTLRSTFPTQDTVQIQSSFVPSLTTLRPAHGWREANLMASELEDTLMSLTEQPPWRAFRINVLAGRSLLVIVLDHLLIDGFGADVFDSELHGALLETHAGSDAFARAPVSYYDWSDWQRSVLGGTVGTSLLEHWADVLDKDDALPDLNFISEQFRPLDRPTTKPAHVRLAIHGSELLRYATDNQITPRTILLSAYALSLCAASNRDEAVIIAPVSGRSFLPLQDVIGWLANRVPLRIRPTLATTFAELTAHVAEVVLDAEAHGLLPYGVLARSLSPRRFADNQRHPWAYFDLAQAPNDSRGSTGPLLRVPLPLRKAFFPGYALWARVAVNEALELQAQFDTSYLRSVDAARVLTRVGAIVAAAIQNPGIQLDELSRTSSSALHAGL
jgi:acyl carrier protein